MSSITKISTTMQYSVKKKQKHPKKNMQSQMTPTETIYCSTFAIQGVITLYHGKENCQKDRAFHKKGEKEARDREDRQELLAKPPRTIYF